jgi:ABC-2 type transport system permease protein
MTRLNEIRRNPAIAVLSENQSQVKVQGPWQIAYMAYIFAGFTVMFIFFISGASASSLLYERETGVLRRLLAAPIPPGDVISGKMLAYLIVVCLQVILLFGVARFAFSAPLGNSVAGLVFLTLAVGLSATSLGMLLAALSRSAKQAESLGMILGFVLAGIGGSVAINPGMMFFQAEGLMGFLAKLTPQGHAVKGFYSLMTENATFVQVLPQILILLGMSAVFYLVARWRFRFVV